MKSKRDKIGGVMDLAHTNALIEALAVSTKNAIDQVRADLGSEISGLRAEMKEGFEKMEARFDRLEMVVGGHGRRLDIVEDGMRQVKTKLGL